MAVWYVSSVDYSAISPWTPTTVYSAGSKVRQATIPAVNSERIFQTISGGTSGSAEPTWNTNKGGLSPSDGSITTGANGWVEITGTSWAAPHSRMFSAIGWSIAGDDFNVHNNHNETQSTTSTLTFAGTPTQSNRVFSCSTANAVAGPNDLIPGATISTTLTSALNINGCVYFYGMNFSTGSASSIATLSLGGSSATSDLIFKDCSFSFPSTAACILQLGGMANKITTTIFSNTTVSFGSVTTGIDVAGGSFVWRNTPSAILGSVPTPLISSSTLSRGAIILLDSIDLSAMGSGSTIISTGGLTTAAQIVNCKLGASVLPALVTGGGQHNGVDLINCDSQATNYRNERYRYQGTQLTETVIVQTTNGASDGSTTISWKVSTIGGCKIQSPFECLTIEQWIDVTNQPKTATIQCLASSVLTNADIWVDCYYLGNSSFPIATEISTKPINILTPGTNLTASISTWGGSLFNATPQQISLSFTTQMRGYVRFVVKVAKSGTLIYIDPSVNII